MKIKNLVYAMLCICVAFVISGCGKNTQGSAPTPSPSPEVTATKAPTAVPTIAEKEPTIAPPENFEITIYTLNPDSLEKEAVTVLVTGNEELTPEFIAEQVIDAMEDEGFYIGINDIIVEGESVRIDFKSDAAPVIDVGASVEGSIIDILAQSILDNLSQYKKIYISIEGGPYYTGHIEFELDEVYLGR
jgi:hypothetical protein